jgi:GT2 family glycosyltransferase
MTDPGRAGDRRVDVLVPTYRRPAALAATLTGLIGQTHCNLRVVLSDQSDGGIGADAAEVRAAARVLEHTGRPVSILEHLPRRGLAEQRQFLLDQAHAPYALFLDDDVILEPDVIERLLHHLDRERCGFIGAFANAPSAVRSDKPIDEPPPDISIHPWDGQVEPENVTPDHPTWNRRLVHFAAYPLRIAARDGLDLSTDRLYRVAWVGGCVLYNTRKLRAVGGFSFWPRLPPNHVGEDVLAQLLVMRRFGGAAVLPSGAWHQEVPTTTRDRRHDAPHVLDPDTLARP